MAFIDGNNGENFATEGLIQRLHFFCVIKEGNDILVGYKTRNI
jgi:hypothetical protein